MVLWLFSIVADVWVLGYHIAEMPHPKFRLRLPRLISIDTHAFSGASECITGVFLFGFQRGSEGRRFLMQLLLLFSALHITTAIYQSRIVFGVRKIMVPA